MSPSYDKVTLHFLVHLTPNPTILHTTTFPTPIPTYLLTSSLPPRFYPPPPPPPDSAPNRPFNANVYMPHFHPLFCRLTPPPLPLFLTPPVSNTPSSPPPPTSHTPSLLLSFCFPPTSTTAPLPPPSSLPFKHKRPHSTGEMSLTVPYPREREEEVLEHIANTSCSSPADYPLTTTVLMMGCHGYASRRFPPGHQAGFFRRLLRAVRNRVSVSFCAVVAVGGDGDGGGGDVVVDILVVVCALVWF